MYDDTYVSSSKTSVHILAPGQSRFHQVRYNSRHEVEQTTVLDMAFCELHSWRNCGILRLMLHDVTFMASHTKFASCGSVLVRHVLIDHNLRRGGSRCRGQF